MVRVIKVKGPLMLEFPDGTRVRIDPAKAPKSVTAPAGRPGRPLSPATVAMKAAMEHDKRAGKVRERTHYFGILRDSGHTGSEASAYLIVSREAKRVFGTSLPRQKGLKRARRAGGGKRGRRPSHETELLRGKMAADKASTGLKDARQYLAWLMDQPGVTLGLKQARPIVYRELRAASP
ncbi:MAG TPA: hypothetical protein VM286_08690 [Candidatus Thermoplasmatota archaeon]|nr:hypothetical protein [Candidatus Thermoplasmatota archaeon]